MNRATPPLAIVHNLAAHRFEANVEGKLCHADYRRVGDTLHLHYTEVPPPLEGHGIAGELVQATLDYAEANQLTVMPPVLVRARLHAAASADPRPPRVGHARLRKRSPGPAQRCAFHRRINVPFVLGLTGRANDMANDTRYDDLTRAIKDTYPRLPNRLQGVARFALGNPDAMALSTVAEIAGGASVPPSAVIRFANALGYHGFTEMQRIYRARLVERSATYRERIATMRKTGGDKGHVLPQLIDSAMHELERLREHLDTRRLAAATELVVNARTVYLLAQRRAFPVAGYLAYGLAQLEIRAFLLDSVGGMLRQQVGLVGRGDVLLAASFRNYTAEVVEAAELARKRRAKIVAITDHPVSPLARAAHVTLEIGDDPAVQFRSLVAPLCAAQALVMSVGYAMA
jgi:DNA-binding MurR/RpiR family transcriptional regulator/predicted GNAT family acetyltransferase